MRALFNIFIFSLTFLQLAQGQIKVVLKDSSTLKANHLYGIDNFNTLYYTTDDGTFNKKTKDTIITYTNFQLNKITSANAFNPLKINLFYEDFNTVVILDNRLAEIFKIDFNNTVPYKNVSFVSTGADNTIWVFNQDLQQLELYNYKSNSTLVKTVPIQSKVLDLKSDYNFCFLLTEAYLYVYNYFGSLIYKYQNIGYKKMAFSKANVILNTEDKLFILPKNTGLIQAIEIEELLINQFLVTNQSLYIYTNQTLLTYNLKTE